jgi:polyvinyl alcohol dehydrogenase (cytochrome)
MLSSRKTVERGFGALLIAFAAMIANLGTPAQAGPVQDPTRQSPGLPNAARFPEGETVYRVQCASCHEGGIARAPQRVLLGYMTADRIVEALSSGAMRSQGSALSERQRIDVAQYLSGQKIGSSVAYAPVACTGKHAAFDRAQVPAYTNWGITDEGTHAIPAAVAGIGLANVRKLKLKWAFGFPNANRARSQPAVGGGAIFVGSHGGTVYALDRDTGCVRWSYEAGAEVRTGIVLQGWKANDHKARPLVWFGDWRGNVHAVEAFTGKPVWRISAHDHPSAVITATPVYYQGALYVGVSSLEEASAATPGYLCCSFRGVVLALDAATGSEKWRRWLVDEAKPQQGGKFLGPAGMPVWAGMAIDPRRQRLLIATGGSYSRPASPMTDSVIGLDLANGNIAWNWQAVPDDAWNVDCFTTTKANCPDNPGPDYNFGTGPVLAKGSDGREYVVDGQKSGIAFALDPDTGKLVWKRQVGRGGLTGGTHFGVATVDGRLIVPITDMPDGQPHDRPAAPGLYALDIATGEYVWQVPAPQICADRPLCVPGYSGAVTVTPELLLAGSDDGFVRIHDVRTGELLWEYDMMRDFATVDGVPGRGGAVSGGAAPVAVGGQLIVSSGYGFVSKMPGNVLLVFEVE